MSQLANKIEARDVELYTVLNEKKYTVDYFQREYSWERKHMEELITDLISSFFNSYQDGHKRNQVENYNSYYLGPFVISTKGGVRQHY